MGARPGNNPTFSGLPILTPSSTPTPLGVPSEPSIQPYSCLQCKHRKVKCDRIDPCIHCRKAGAECIYRAPPPPKRRKRGQPDVSETGSAADTEPHEAVVSPRDYVVEREDLLDKVRRYETMLKDLGALKRATVGTLKESASSNSVPEQPPRLAGGSAARTPDSTTMDGEGKLITKYGKSRYLENVLWTSVRDEFSDPHEILEDFSDNNMDDDNVSKSDTVGTGRPTVPSMAQDPLDMVFPLAANKSTLVVRSLHPRPVEIFMLWQAFVDNVNPIIKLFHVPTTQKAILEATADLGRVSKAMEALLFGIYLIAVLSMEDAECQSTLHQSKAAALDRFRIGAQEALRAAGILRTSDMMVLQAFVLFLVSLPIRVH